MTQTSLGESVVQKEIHAQAKNNGVAANITHTQPLWLLAEVTYRCPLHCAFCYNPTDYDKHTQNELTTEQWINALRDARKMGAIQLGISGGEPLLRDDIEDIVIEAKKLGYYSNLITSGVGLTEKRIQAFKDGGQTSPALRLSRKRRSEIEAERVPWGDASWPWARFRA